MKRKQIIKYLISPIQATACHIDATHPDAGYCLPDNDIGLSAALSCNATHGTKLVYARYTGSKSKKRYLQIKEKFIYEKSKK